MRCRKQWARKQPITLQLSNWTISPTWDQSNELFGPVLLIKVPFLKLLYHPLILNCGTNVCMSCINPDLYLFLNEQSYTTKKLTLFCCQQVGLLVFCVDFYFLKQFKKSVILLFIYCLQYCTLLDLKSHPLLSNNNEMKKGHFGKVSVNKVTLKAGDIFDFLSLFSTFQMSGKARLLAW